MPEIRTHVLTQRTVTDNPSLSLNEQKFILRLFQGQISQNEKMSYSRDSRFVDVINKKLAKIGLPNAVLKLDRFGNTAKRYRPLAYGPNPAVFEGEIQTPKPSRKDLEYYFSNDHRFIIDHLLKDSHSTYEQLKHAFFKQNKQTKQFDNIRNRVKEINRAARNLNLDKGIVSILLEGGKVKLVLSRDFTNYFNLDAAKPDFHELLTAKQKRLVNAFELKGQWWRHDLHREVGFDSSTISKLLRRINQNLSAAGYPKPFASGADGRYVWHRITPEFEKEIRTHVPDDLDAYFRPDLREPIKYIAENPGFTVKDYAKKLGIDSLAMSRKIFHILRTIRENDLPEVYYLKGIGFVLSNEFAKRFALKPPGIILSHLLEGNKQRIFEYRLSNPTAPPKVIAQQLNIPLKSLKYHLQDVRRLLRRTHFMVPPELRLRTASLPGAFEFDGKLWVPRSMQLKTEDKVKKKVTQMFEDYYKLNKGRSSLPKTTQTRDELGLMPFTMLNNVRAQLVQELESLVDKKLDSPEETNRRNELILGLNQIIDNNYMQFREKLEKLGGKKSLK